MWTISRSSRNAAQSILQTIAEVDWLVLPTDVAVDVVLQILAKASNFSSDGCRIPQSETTPKGCVPTRSLPSMDEVEVDFVLEEIVIEIERLPQEGSGCVVTHHCVGSSNDAWFHLGVKLGSLSMILLANSPKCEADISVGISSIC